MPQTRREYLAGVNAYYDMTPEQRRELQMEAVIRMAKKQVVKNSHCGSEGVWIESEPDLAEYEQPDMLPGRSTKVKLFVLAGVPPCGYVVASWNSKAVVALDWYFRKLWTYKIDSIGATKMLNAVCDIILEKRS